MAAVEGDDEFATQEERLEWLRARGVEIDLVQDKSGPNRPPRRAEAAPPVEESNDRRYFSFVRIPAATTEEIRVERALRDYREGDSLKEWLGPRFADETEIDARVAERETRGQIEKMVVSGQGLKAPSAKTIQTLAKTGGAEAYPLAHASEANGQEAIKLYVDEVGTLRQRPRNPRAERFAAESAGLSGLRIHGDAYVGRTMLTPHGVENLDFIEADLEPSSPWAVDARRTHANDFAAMPSTDLKSGSTAHYDWSQTNEDLEVSVKLGQAGVAKSRLTVDYGKPAGASLFVDLDDTHLVAIPRLFDRISPTDSSWSIDRDRLVITLEKVDPRDWAALDLDA